MSRRMVIAGVAGLGLLALPAHAQELTESAKAILHGLPDFHRTVIADATSTYVRRAGDTMNGKLRMSGAGGVRTCFDLTTQAGYSFGITHSTSTLSFQYFSTDDCSGAAAATHFQMNVNEPGVSTPSTNSTGFTSATNALPAFKASGSGYLQLTGVATASLPACVAGLNGSAHYDTTTATYKWCNGTSWQSVGTGNGTVTAVTGSLGITSSGGTTPNITCDLATAAGQGCVSTAAQSFAGIKEFQGGVQIGTNGEVLTDSRANNLTTDIASIAQSTCSDTAIAVTGAATGSECTVGLATGGGVAGAQFSCYVSASGTVQLRMCCIGAANCDPASQRYNIRTFNQ